MSKSNSFLQTGTAVPLPSHVSKCADSAVSHQLLAAGIGGTVVALVGPYLACSRSRLTIFFYLVNPFDVVKTRLQAQVNLKNAPATAVSTADLTRRYSGSLVRHVLQLRLTDDKDAVYKIVKYEGITSLWIGLRLSLLMAIPATAMYAAFLGPQLTRQLLHRVREPTSVARKAAFPREHARCDHCWWLCSAGECFIYMPHGVD